METIPEETTTTPSFYNKYIKPRLENDPEFRRKFIACQVNRNRKRYQRDEEFRKKKDECAKQHHRNKYANDSEYREKKKQESKRRYQEKKALKLAQENQKAPFGL
jgi:hypothetical protein